MATWWICLMQHCPVNYESCCCSCNRWKSNADERFNFVLRICVELTQNHTWPSSILHTANSEMCSRIGDRLCAFKSFQIGIFMFKAKMSLGRILYEGTGWFRETPLQREWNESWHTAPKNGSFWFRFSPRSHSNCTFTRPGAVFLQKM